MWLIVAFASTGFLVGNLMGMSASSTVPSFLGLLFALFGGSLIVFLHKLTSEDRVVAGKLVFALSLTCLLGVYTGLFVNERELLTPKERRFLPVAAHVGTFGTSCTDREHATAQESGTGDRVQNKYLAAGTLSKIDQIDVEKRFAGLSAEDAYQQLRALAIDRCSPGAQ